MPKKYLDSDGLSAVWGKVKKQNEKSLYHLGAFDTINGNVITRQTGYVKLDGSESWMPAGTTGYLFQTEDYKAPYNNQFVNNQLTIRTADYLWQNTDSGIAFDINRINIRIDNITTIADLQAYLSANTIYIQYKLATSYTEEVIENQPLNTLDQKGSNWLRDEWNKGLNLFDYNSTRKGGYYYFDNGNWTSSNQYMGSDYISVIPNTIYSGNTLGHICFYDISKTYIGGVVLQADGNITTPNNAYYLKYSPNITTDTVMLNEGDHAYPYQKYNGAIVHKKDLPEKYNTSGSSKYIGYNAELNSSPTYVATFKDNYDLNGLCCSSTDALNVGRSKSLLSYSAGGNDDVEALQDAFNYIDKSVGTAVRLEHGSAYMSFGYALSGYNYEHAYGSFLVLGYGLTNPTYVRMNNGTWTSSSLALTSDVNAKQDTLVSGTNIKTINGNSILGSGDITISGGGGIEELSANDIYIYNTASTSVTKITESGIYLLTSDNPTLHVSSSKTIGVYKNTMLYVTINGTYFNWWYINNPNNANNTKELTFGTNGTYTRYTLKDHPHLYMHRITFDGRDDGDCGTLNITIYSTRSTAYTASGVYNYLNDNGYRDTYNMYPAVGYSTEDVNGVNVGAWASDNEIWTRYDNGDGFSTHAWSKYAGTGSYSDRFTDSVHMVF